MIKISNLNKYFNKGKKNELHVLKDISYTFPDTGLVSILGESGSGKSTLINLIGGLLYHEEDIIIDGNTFNNKNISELEEYRNNNIGYIFQSYLVYKDLSVYENLKLSLNVLNIYDLKEINKRIDYVLDILKLTKYKRKKASELSGGEQQRLSIARALIKKCKIYICDEPTGNLDTKNSINVMNILKALSKDSLVILVTHNVSLAKTYSDTIIHMSDGKFTDKEIEDSTINVNSVNNLYLEDFNSKTLTDNNLNITYYSNEDKNIEVKLLYKDNKLYINSPNIEIISNAKILEKRETFESQLEDFKYDNSFYNDIYSKDIPWYKILLTKLFNRKLLNKKDRLLHSCSVILSVIIMFLLFMTSDNLQSLVNINVNYDDKYLVLPSDATESDRFNALVEMYDSGAIKNPQKNNLTNWFAKYSKFPGQNINIHMDTRFLLLPENYKMLYGSASDDGIIISEDIYNNLIKSKGLTFDDISNITFEGVLDNEEHFNTKIAGVIKGGRSTYFTKGFLNNIYPKKYNIVKSDEFKDYEIITPISKDVVIEPSDKCPNLYVEKSTGLRIGDGIDSLYGIVAGYIKENEEYDNLVIVDSKSAHIPHYASMYEHDISPLNDNVVLTEGVMPTKLFEILVPDTSVTPVGTKFYITDMEYKVVGKYDTKKYAKFTSIATTDTVLLSLGVGTYYCYEIVDHNIHNSIATKYDLIVDSDKNIIMDNSFNISQIVLMAVFVLFVILDVVLMYVINRVTFYNNKESFLIIRSISGNTKYVKKRYMCSIIANNIRYLLLPMLAMYLMYTYIFINTTQHIFVTNLFLITFTILLLSSLAVNYLYINKQLKKEPLFLERKYDL